MFAEAILLRQKEDCYEALKSFIFDLGAPKTMIANGLDKQTGMNMEFSATVQQKNDQTRILQKL